MLSVKKQDKHKQPFSDTPQAQLAQLQDAIRRQQKQNQNLQDDLQTLVQRYQTQILPRERQLAMPIKLLIRQLISLYPRKSLSQWQRNEMMDWILEELEHLRMLDPQAADEVIAQYQAMMTEFLQLTAGEIADIRAQAQQEEEQDAEMDDLFEALFQRVNSGQGGPVDAELFDGPEHTAPHQATTANPAESLTPEGWIKQLFRRTARVLHPDREQDPVLRDQKHHLMSALVDARDRRDIMAMLALFNDHVAGSEADFSSEEYPAVIQLLQQQLEQLDDEKAAIIHSSPFHFFLYKNLYSKQKAARERKINAYLQRVDTDCRMRTEQALSLRSVKALQSVLRERVGYSVEFDGWF